MRNIYRFDEGLEASRYYTNSVWLVEDANNSKHDYAIRMKHPLWGWKQPFHVADKENGVLTVNNQLRLPKAFAKLR